MNRKLLFTTICGFLVGPWLSLATLRAEIIVEGDVTPDASIPLLLLGQRLYVGESGAGSLQLTEGSQIESDGGSIGRFAGSSGQVTISGGGSLWDATFVLSPTFHVGVRGVGELTVNQRAGLLTGLGRVGSEIEGEGAVTLDGRGTTWSNDGLRVGDKGTGSLVISNGATAVSTGSGRIGTESGASGSVTVTNPESAWTHTEYLVIAAEGNGTLEILDGGLVTNTWASVAQSDGTIGQITVSGEGSQWLNSETLTIASGVGDDGASRGILSIDQGGYVESHNFASIAFSEGSTAFVSVDGELSRWDHFGELSVGVGGTGSLDISNGAAVTSDVGHLGFAPNGNGNATISGEGSQWIVAKELWVGLQSPGNLSIDSGGRAESEFGYVGAFSTGDVTVTGETSKWTVEKDLYVGGFEGGVGTVNLSDKAQITVKDNDLILGVEELGEGSVILDTESVMEVGGLTIVGSGVDSVATLTIRNGSTFDAEDDIHVAVESGSFGTINVETEGILDLHGNDILVGDGDADFNMLSGTVRNTSIFGTDLRQLGGRLAAGNSPGSMQIQGNYTLEAGGTIEIELAGHPIDGGTAGLDFDYYLVDGEAILMGAIDVRPDGDYVPHAGDTFDVLNAASIDMTAALLTGLANFRSEIIPMSDGRQTLRLIHVPEPNMLAFFAWATLISVAGSRRSRSQRQRMHHSLL
ncbi:MAG: hypothetical protein KDA60_06725 [Planctomycetales bacterium]|nr:hypothetical protein [Planctomycetales bacterium]